MLTDRGQLFPDGKVLEAHGLDSSSLTELMCLVQVR